MYMSWCWEIAPHDAVSFAHSVELLIRDGQLRQEMGAEAVKHIRRKVTVQSDVENTLRLYEML